jgi:hypothetical protein
MLFDRKKKDGSTNGTQANLTTTNQNGQDDSLIGQNADLTTQLAEANSVIAKYEAQEKLRTKADKLGYEGCVGELFTQKGEDYTATLEAMIDETEKSDSNPSGDQNASQFLTDSNPSLGDGSTNGDYSPTASFTTSQEAILHARNELGMTSREATAHCRQTYPKLFNEGN